VRILSPQEERADIGIVVLSETSRIAEIVSAAVRNNMKIGSMAPGFLW
jgi:hypothetical protein